jgi:RNA polymerase sporulation-specific sigma factor
LPHGGDERVKKLLAFIAKLKSKLFEIEVDYINGPDTLPPPLTKDEENLRLEKLEAGDVQAREELIVHNLRLVVYIAKKFESTGIGVEDLVSIGSIGLIKAVNTFCPDRNIKLATYASRCIENEILMYLRKNNLQKTEISIDEPLNIDWDGNELLLSDVLGTDPDTINSHIEQEVERDVLLNAVSKLSPREREIMQMRFGLGGYKEHTQKEVAALIGISQSYISRLEKKIIHRLKKDIENLI